MDEDFFETGINYCSTSKINNQANKGGDIIDDNLKDNNNDSLLLDDELTEPMN